VGTSEVDSGQFQNCCVVGAAVGAVVAAVVGASQYGVQETASL